MPLEHVPNCKSLLVAPSLGEIDPLNPSSFPFVVYVRTYVTLFAFWRLLNETRRPLREGIKRGDTITPLYARVETTVVDPEDEPLNRGSTLAYVTVGIAKITKTATPLAMYSFLSMSSVYTRQRFASSEKGACKLLAYLSIMITCLHGL